MMTCLAGRTGWKRAQSGRRRSRPVEGTTYHQNRHAESKLPYNCCYHRSGHFNGNGQHQTRLLIRRKMLQTSSVLPLPKQSSAEQSQHRSRQAKSRQAQTGTRLNLSRWRKKGSETSKRHGGLVPWVSRGHGVRCIHIFSHEQGLA